MPLALCTVLHTIEPVCLYLVLFAVRDVPTTIECHLSRSKCVDANAACINDGSNTGMTIAKLHNNCPYQRSLPTLLSNAPSQIITNEPLCCIFWGMINKLASGTTSAHLYLVTICESEDATPLSVIFFLY